MRISTEALAVAGDAREERGLGRRQLWLVVDAHMDTYTDLDDAYARADAYAYAANANAEVYTVVASVGSDADADTVAGPYSEAHAYTDVGVNRI